MPDTDEILIRLGVEPASMRDGDLEVRSPITGEPIARVASGTPTRSTPRSPRATAAFEAWRDVPAPRRGEFVRLLGEELRARRRRSARWSRSRSARSSQEGLGEVQEMIDICDFAVGLSRQLYGLTIASERPGHRMIETVASARAGRRDHRVQLPGRRVGVERGARAASAATRSSGSRRRRRRSPRSPCQRSVERGRERCGDAPDGRLSGRHRRAPVGAALVDDPRLPLVSATGSTRMGRAIAPRVAGRLGRSAARARRQQRA